MRKGFNFYHSYFEIMNELDDESIALFIKSLTNVQFLKVHIDEIKFEDKLLSMAWKSIKHSIQKQLEGYCSADGLKYSSMFDDKSVPMPVPPEGPYAVPMSVPPIQVQGEVQGEVQVQGDNNASLRSATHTPNKQKKEKAKSNQQWDSYIKESYEEDAVDFALDFITYREQIKEPIKTAQAISLYMNEVIVIHEKYGVSTLSREIDRMKAGAWKTLYPEYKNKGK